jgi:hypothetical protein
MERTEATETEVTERTETEMTEGAETEMTEGTEKKVNAEKRGYTEQRRNHSTNFGYESVRNFVCGHSMRSIDAPDTQTEAHRRS